MPKIPVALLCSGVAMLLAGVTPIVAQDAPKAEAKAAPEAAGPSPVTRATEAYAALLAARKSTEENLKPTDSPAMAKARAAFEKASTQAERDKYLAAFRAAMDAPEQAAKEAAFAAARADLISTQTAFKAAFRMVAEWPQDADADMLIEGIVMNEVRPGVAATASTRASLDKLRKLKATSELAIAARDLAMAALVKDMLASSQRPNEVDLGKPILAMREEFSPLGMAHFCDIIGHAYLERGAWEDAGKSFREGLALLKDLPKKHRLSEIKDDLNTMSLVGMKAPEIVADYALGTTKTKLTEYQDSILVLDFWATWCPPCLAALPVLDDLALAYAGKGVAVLGITREYKKRGYLPVSMEELRGAASKNGTQYLGDTAEAFKAHIEAFRKNTKVSFPFMVGQASDMQNYRLAGIPSTFIVNKEGVIVFAAVAASEADLRAALERLLAEKPASEPEPQHE